MNMLRFSFILLIFTILVSSQWVWAQETSHTWPSLAPSHEKLPLDAERSIRIQTNEGTWISLDIHPNGQLLVMEFMGDLYTLPISGGEATRLTRGLAFDSQPRFSPDGKNVVFISDRDGGDNIWLLNMETKELTQRTQGKNYRFQSPVFTPDGQYIIAARAGLRSGVHKLWMYHRDGGSGTEFIDTPTTLKMIEPAFGGNDRYLWYSQRTADWNYNAIFPQYQLGMFDRETGERHTKSARLGSAFRPTLSSDGKWLVYGTRHETETGLRIRNLETGDERWLAYPVQRDDKESRATRDVLPGMAFTPDNQAIVTTWGGRLWRVPIQEGAQATEIPFSIDAEIDLGPRLEFEYPIEDTEHFIARQIRNAVPSPDGTQIAFSVLNRIYVKSLPDGTPRRLTNFDKNEAFPTWSPDGTWIAFATWTPEEGGHVYRMRANGRRSPQKLTQRPAVYQHLAWSATQDRIVAIRGDNRVYFEAPGPFVPGANDELIWIPAGGGTATVIASTDGRRSPHFVQNNDRIFLHHPARGLLSIRWDGTDEREHLRVTGPTPPGANQPARASTILMAPQGDQALAELGSDMYMVTVPRAGEAQTINVSNPDRAIFPVIKMTDIGGQFPAWSWDGRTAHWSIGNAFVSFSKDDYSARKRELEAYDRKKKKAQKEKSDKDDDKNGNETTDTPSEVEDVSDEKPKSYKPQEIRIEIAVRRDLPNGILVLRGGTAITMNGYEIIENADIVIRNNRIYAIGERGSVTIPDGATIRDIQGKTVIPGFVDTHAHIRPFRDLHQPQIWSFMANLAYGVTTVRDPQTGTTDLLTYADMVTNGMTIGPRIYQTGPGIFWNEQIRNLDHARDIMKRYSAYFDTKTIKMYVAGNREQRQWIVMAAKEQEIMPTTEGSLNMKLNMDMLLDGYAGQEHNFPISPVFSDVIEVTAFSQMAYTPTLLVTYGGPWAENYFFERENALHDQKLRYFTPLEDLERKARRRGAGWFHEDEYVMDRQAKIVRQLYDAGGLIGVGSHGQLQGLGYHWELWAMAREQVSPHAALQIATIQGAKALGLAGDIGSLEAGKLADLVILSENPLENLRNTNTITHVMSNGRLFNGNNLHEEWPRQRATGILPWQQPEPINLPGKNQ